jgi:uncharacterized protein
MDVSLERMFCCYARSDSQFVLRIVKDLRAAGTKPWVDQLDIANGERWDQAIERELLSCGTLLVFLSPASVASENVRDEVAFALHHHKKVVPILFHDCDIPLQLRRIQFIDFRGSYKEGFAQLMKAVSSPPPAPPPPPPAENDVIPAVQIPSHSFRRAKTQLAAVFLAGGLAGALSFSLIHWNFDSPSDRGAKLFAPKDEPYRMPRTDTAPPNRANTSDGAPHQEFAEICEKLIKGPDAPEPEPGVPPGSENALGIVTAPAGGTFFQFGSDIAKIAGADGLPIRVRETQGSIENVDFLASPRENAALGIVASEYLYFLEASKIPLDRLKVANLRMVAPLFKEEVHVLVRDDIRRVEDLEGKRVVLGVKGLGSRFTALRVLGRLGISVNELDYPPERGICAVISGDADAMFYVAGKPVGFLQRIDSLKSPYPDLVGHLRLLQVPQSEALYDYSHATITPDDYAWLSEPIETIASRALLVSYHFSKVANSYQAKRCRQLAQLGKVLRTRLPQLQNPANSFHKKWDEVDLDERVPRWQTDTCFQP